MRKARVKRFIRSFTEGTKFGIYQPDSVTHFYFSEYNRRHRNATQEGRMLRARRLGALRSAALATLQRSVR